LSALGKKPVERDTDELANELGPVLEFLRAVWALNHAIERTSIRMESALGLTAQQRFVIRILGELPGISPGQLAELLHVDRGSVTAIIKRLEARDQVVRRADAKDGRRVSLTLTTKGRHLNVPAPVSVERAVELALDRSTAADVAAVRRVLGRLVTALDEVSVLDDP